MNNSITLFDPIHVGDLHLPNRIFMAPLTRLRGTLDNLATPIMADYYAQRASAGLIISESIAVHPLGVGYRNVPGLWNQRQIQSWQPITDAVHKAGGHIYAQLWHAGRASDPSLLNGERPVGPSAVPATGTVSLLRPVRAFVTPRALETSEVTSIISTFKSATKNALEAGFDGVELQAANGYHLDQFLQDSSNLRRDEYGGSIENRARLLLECTDAAISIYGAGGVAVHLSPRGSSNGVTDSDPEATFGYVAKELGRRNIAFLAAREKVSADHRDFSLRSEFGGVYVANGADDQRGAQELLDKGEADAVAFGTLFIANPDLPRRFAEGTLLNEPDPASFYTPGPIGYTDYPMLCCESSIYLG
jgi:2,4-dienoyl-CoA reductase-like NADH-dependent reductase (Old Yellow Enzyme family)